MSSPFLGRFRRFPTDDDALLERELVNSYTDVSVAVNQREIADYQLEELLTGQKFFPSATNGPFRNTYRKVVQISAVAAGATLNTAHGISGLTAVTRIYGVAVTSTDFRPLPYASVTANANIELRIDTTNITVIAGAASPNLSSALVIVEYFR